MPQFLRALLLTLSLAAVLGGCAQLSGVTQSPTPVLEGVIARGALRVGTSGNMPPYNMRTKAGEVVGLEVDLARAMAEAMGVDLVVETRPFAELLPALQAGEFDMVLSSVTMTPQRNLHVAFVGPYYVSGKCFLTKRETIARAENGDQVNRPDVKVATLAGSTSEDFVRVAMPEAQLTATPDYDAALKLVLDDKVHALVADYAFCAVSVLRYPGSGLVPAFTRLTYEPIGVALPAGDPLLVNWVENFLNLAQETGALEELSKSWLEDPTWLDNLP